MPEIDEELTRRVKQGDDDALLQYAKACKPQLLAFVERNLSDAMRRKVEAVDIVQDASISAFNSIGEVDLSEREPFSWLCHLAERKIIDAHRKYFGAQKRSASREVGLGSPGSESRPGGIIDMLITSMTSPSKAFSRNQREFKLLQALETLPEEQRAAIRLRYVEGLPTKEIAAQIGKSDVATRVMLSRSLSKLQEVLGDDSQMMPNA
jgi:RNA polymerase sigma-70 factor (ECF subfamily)